MRTQANPTAMLEIAIAAIVVSLVAGAFGFTGVARGAANVAKVIFGHFDEKNG